MLFGNNNGNKDVKIKLDAVDVKQVIYLKVCGVIIDWILSKATTFFELLIFTHSVTVH